MEPYLESLAKGLLVKTDASVKEVTQNRWENSAVISRNPVATNSSSSSAEVAQLAAAIRARRAKATEAAALNPAGIRQGLMVAKSTTLASSNSNGSQIQNSKIARKLDTQGLLTAYLKGRRDFAQHNLSLLNLQGSDLSGTNFHSAQMHKTNLQGANLHNSDFGRASLMGANLRDANLTKAYLNNADLEAADLRGADLTHVNFSNANLKGANLCGANLTGAKIADEQLAQAKTNWMTVRPNGKRGLL
jgi:serine/threonine-protein kinase